MQTDKKVLLKITNLKQYFPLKEKGKFVKANDGIDIDIYEGETLGLVGESGCGKSTFGRTVLELYKQTDGQVLYYGRSLDDFAPEYVIETVRNLPKMREKWRALSAKEEHAKQAFENAKEEEKGKYHEAYLLAKKEAHGALLNIANVFGGFITVDDPSEAQALFAEAYKHAHNIRKIDEKLVVVRSELADAEYEVEHKNKGAAKVEKLKVKCAALEDERKKTNDQIAEVIKKIDAIRAPYANDPEFQKYDVYRQDGVDLARLKTSEMRKFRSDMQLIFQDPYSSLNPRMTVGQIIGEGMTAHNYFKKNSARMQDRVLEIMEMCGLAKYFIHRFPHQFSGGQRQRIGIARALSTNPKFVICDEAVSALDVSIQSQIINLLQDLKEKQKLTYLFITHDLSVVKYISDRIGVMYLGNLVELAESQEMFDHPLHPYTEALLSAIPTTNVDVNREPVILEGDIPSPVNPPKGCKFHTRCKYCTDVCKQITPELIEIKPNHFVACHHILEQNK